MKGIVGAAQTGARNKYARVGADVAERRHRLTGGGAMLRESTNDDGRKPECIVVVADDKMTCRRERRRPDNRTHRGKCRESRKGVRSDCYVAFRKQTHTVATTGNF